MLLLQWQALVSFSKIVQQVPSKKNLVVEYLELTAGSAKLTLLSDTESNNSWFDLQRLQPTFLTKSWVVLRSQQSATCTFLDWLEPELVETSLPCVIFPLVSYASSNPRSWITVTAEFSFLFSARSDTSVQLSKVPTFQFLWQFFSSLKIDTLLKV